ncbi:HAD family hydrolase [Cytobacillus sp. NCCP-133]|uniref:HAD family hydrolase n=1 Tax=Cytobacillus sp. NCCP-133 TaxID=766848 RepID=UPI00222F9006|nr:hypothetical protein [Cytobacillus sp. NCCP-133]GLB57877.1 hypothetical protein NCCP133_00100 [Cytobacillus sp. NCCP-133]
MMMFASDLDRTLIYSNRALSEFGHAGREGLIGAERKEGHEIAYTTGKALKMLMELSTRMHFIPVTTRTYEQYKRVVILNKLPVSYAVTSNGANIHFQGNPLEDWTSIVHKRLSSECGHLEDIVEKLKGYELNGRIKIADNLFVYYILNKQITGEEKEVLSRTAESFGWRVSLQGRKLYFMPAPICKGEAVKFIKEREGVTTLFGAGDSILDHDFLKFCDYSFVPKHGELAKMDSLCLLYKISNKRGVMAGEEILAEILGHIKQKI